MEFLKNDKSKEPSKDDEDISENGLKFLLKDSGKGGYLDIWDDNPTFRDILSTPSLIKSFTLIALELFFMVFTYTLTLDLIISIGIAFFALIFFIVAFYDKFFSLKHFVRYNFSKFSRIEPFENTTFWNLTDDPSMMLIVNKENLINVALRVFKIEVIAENVQPNLNHFLKSLNDKNIEYTYQIVQKPRIDISNHNNIEKNLERIYEHKSIKSLRTQIYFSIYYDVKGILNNSKLTALQKILNKNTRIMKAILDANFNHIKVVLLSDIDLTNAIRTFFFKQNYDTIQKDNDLSISKDKIPLVIIKILFLVFLTGYFSYIAFIVFNVTLLYLIVYNLAIVLPLLFIWWRSIFFQFTKIHLYHNEKAIPIDPFKNISFYQFKNIPTSIFAHVNNKLLIDMKIFNLYSASQPIFSFSEKFFRAMINQKIHFVYTIIAAPTSYYLFNKEVGKYVNEKTKEILNEYITTPKTQKNWLSMRSGIWRTITTLSLSTYKFTDSLVMGEIIDMEEEITLKYETLKAIFEINFSNLLLKGLRNEKLVSGFLCEVLKNKFFTRNGTHLNYIYFQGKTLMKLKEIAQDLKKGIETRIAAEFNTPLQLENFITIGNTINTEFLEEEIPMGFTLEQLKTLLIANGTTKSRDLLAQKIVSELVTANVPTIIFDYSGNWSKIIKYFEVSRYENDFLYFKLGQTFNIKMFHSGIKDDPNNIDYLNYFFDAYALAFKKDDRTMESLKNAIFNNPDLNLASFHLRFKNQQKWEKNNPVMEAIVSTLFNDFSQQTISFFYTPENPENTITFQDMICDDKTVIIDLSVLKDLRMQLFATFVMISKVIHLIRNKDDYYSKTIIIPNIDQFFDNFYLEKNANYWKINKFLDPLLQEGFGLITSANQVRNLHSNAFKYFHNIITFKTADKRDISVIQNQMNLKQTYGAGLYSSKRKFTYQIEYLMNMKEDEVLIKRSDINQPFPGKINSSEFNNTIPLTYDQIIEYMHNQGYDLKYTEQRLLDQTRKTLFELNLGEFIHFLEEIMKFLDAVRLVDKVGNLYKGKLKSQLLKFIYDKASKLFNKDKKQIHKVRGDLFEALIKQEYLVETHPTMAGGGEALRTSYKVGPQYQKALEDYYQTRPSYENNITLEVIEKGSGKASDIENIFQEHSVEDRLKEEKFNALLLREKNDFLWNLFQIHMSIKRGEYIEAIEVGENIIYKYLSNVYRDISETEPNGIINGNNPDGIIAYLTNIKDFPFTKEELIRYIEKNEELKKNEKPREIKAKKMYELLENFHHKL